MAGPADNMRNNWDPSDNIEFWKERLERSKRKGRVEDSVFVGGNWNHINRVHKEIWQRYIKPEHSVLDAGCGYGRTKELIDCSRYFGVDGSPDLVEEGKKLYGEFFLACDVRNMPFSDSEFDWSVCIGVRGNILINKDWWERWVPIELELFRVSKLGIIYMQYTDPSYHYVVFKQ